MTHPVLSPEEIQALFSAYSSAPHESSSSHAQTIHHECFIHQGVSHDIEWLESFCLRVSDDWMKESSRLFSGSVSVDCGPFEYIKEVDPFGNLDNKMVIEGGFFNTKASAFVALSREGVHGLAEAFFGGRVEDGSGVVNSTHAITGLESDMLLILAQSLFDVMARVMGESTSLYDEKIKVNLVDSFSGNPQNLYKTTFYMQFPDNTISFELCFTASSVRDLRFSKISDASSMYSPALLDNVLDSPVDLRLVKKITGVSLKKVLTLQVGSVIDFGQCQNASIFANNNMLGHVACELKPKENVISINRLVKGEPHEK